MQKCKLCQKDEELQNSHIIPRFFYKFMQKTTNNQIVQFDGQKNLWQISNRQLKARLFCRNCEQLLSKNETEFSKIFHDINNQKPSERQAYANLDELMGSLANDDNSRDKDFLDTVGYIIKSSPFYNKEDIIRYFAISYIFRELCGKNYNISSALIKKFRQYLYNKKSFDFLLIIRINNVSNFDFITTTIVWDKLEDCKHFLFYIPNMLFHIIVHINDEIKNEFKKLIILPDNLLNDEMQVLAYVKKIQDNPKIAQNLQYFGGNNPNQSI